ncbi:MAG: hypothetical protein ACTHMI_18315 [Mucilaginibacter sp.]
MKQKDVFKKIGGILQELSEQYEYLETVSDNLNDLELELFVANAHFLTDHIEILCKLNLQNRPKRPVIEKPEGNTYQQKFFEPVVQQMKPGADIKGIRPNVAAPKPSEAEINKKRPEAEKPAETSVEKPAEKEIKKEEQVEAKFDFPEKVAEEHSGPKFDFSSDTPKDSYSFIREEPETIRHELILDEAETWDDDTEQVQEDTNEVKAAAEAEEEEEKKGEAQVPVVTEEQPEIIELPAPKEQKEDAAEEKDKVLPEATAKTEEAKTEEPKTEAVAEERPADKPDVKDEDELVTRNQKISSQMGEKQLSKTDQLAIKPISDIKLAITLNDKLLYVKDLFNGYNLAYSEAIEILNRFTTFEEAQRFLRANYVTKNNWESKQATADKFYALLRRRYA